MSVMLVAEALLLTLRRALLISCASCSAMAVNSGSRLVKEVSVRAGPKNCRQRELLVPYAENT